MEHEAAPAAGAVLRAYTTSSVLSFVGTAMVMPFEVGKTLAQVQWVPKDGLDTIMDASDEGVIEEETVEVSSESSLAMAPSRLQSETAVERSQ